MPKRSREELILAKEKELAELRAGVDKSKQTRHDKLDKTEIPALTERIDKLIATRQAKIDERDLIAREIADSKQAEANASVSVGA